MTWEVRVGDCAALMREMPEASVDAVVCDPPYGINFLGHAWDGSAIAAAARRDAETRVSLGPHSPSRPGRAEPRGSSAFGAASSQAGAYDFSAKGNRAFQAWCEAWATEALRVLKPGGYAVAFGATRTAHRLTAGLEDAGFEIRDTLLWLFGQGFPKGTNMAKAIDRRLGAEREVVGERMTNTSMQGGNFATGPGNGRQPVDVTASATEEARRWEGWNTALKPAYEPIVLARKPAGGSVVNSVLEHGTGALNIDGCRVAGPSSGGRWGGRNLNAQVGYSGGYDEEYVTEEHPLGRWPANVLCDAAAAAMIDAQAGDRGGGYGVRGDGVGYEGGFNNPTYEQVGYGDAGGASRFFYSPKVNAAERNAGVERVPAGLAGGANKWTDQDTRRDTPNVEHENDHPTVKPVDLMRWLCRLVTPPGGLILDPFAGSGTTGCAAVLQGFRFIGLEREEPYADIARQRIAWWAQRDPSKDTAAIVDAARDERRVLSAGQLTLEMT